MDVWVHIDLNSSLVYAQQVETFQDLHPWPCQPKFTATTSCVQIWPAENR